MTDPFDFYAKEDEWSIPTNPRIATDTTIEPTSGNIEPTYLLAQLPGEEEQEFILTRPFTPGNKQNMIAFMAGRSDPENYGELVTLELPRQETVLGPSQVDNLLNQDVEISRTLTLLNQQDSVVHYGSLVVLPVDDAFVYVQPLFVEAAGTGTEAVGIPELKRVVVVFGEEVSFAETFGEALAQAFDLEAPPATGQPPPEDGAAPPPQQPSDGATQELIEEANALYERAQEALQDGDLARYGRLIERLGRLLEEAQGGS
jgi:uncharacterized protein